MLPEKNDFTFPAVKEVPSRFRNALGKYRIIIRKTCTNCGVCIQTCPHGVFKKGVRRPKAASDHLCLGPSCTINQFCCVTRCPEKAISLTPNPSFEVLGDKRWPGDLLASTWHMAATGKTPHQELNFKTGESNGGFDKIRFVFPRSTETVREEEISTAIELNHSGDGRPKITIPVPFYLGGMSFGSVSLVTMLSRVRAAATLGTFCCTGEGGY
ncbi:MAG TPA: glutamate synthase-related protein, partial [Syntrophorhabdaceae bacterium]|nr:glutamate synthase-related protein [Syntrophorhabdaceae bacterium]